MTLSEVNNIAFTLFNGKNKVTNLVITETKLLPTTKLAYANVMRNLWLKFGNSYYYFTNNLKPIQYNLSEVDCNGKRRVDFGDTSYISLPQNMHLFRIEAITGAGCYCSTITFVMPGEDYFYRGAEFASFPYAVAIGDGVDTYHIPNCIKKVTILGVSDDPDVNIPQDIAWDVLRQVLALILDIKKYPQKTIDDYGSALQELIKDQKLNTITPQ